MIASTKETKGLRRRNHFLIGCSTVVVASQRAGTTARIAFESDPQPFAPLDLLKTDPAEKAAQIAAIMKEIRGYSGSDNLVLVTHLEDIEALTGVSPREGEAVVVTPEGDGLKVLGRVTF